MGQVTIYLDKETEIKMKKAAKSNHLSVSKWVARIIREQIKTEWPHDFFKLAGSWENTFPSLDEIRNTQGADCKRESF